MENVNFKHRANGIYLDCIRTMFTVVNIYILIELSKKYMQGESLVNKQQPCHYGLCDEKGLNKWLCISMDKLILTNISHIALC